MAVYRLEHFIFNITVTVFFCSALAKDLHCHYVWGIKPSDMVTCHIQRKRESLSLHFLLSLFCTCDCYCGNGHLLTHGVIVLGSKPSAPAAEELPVKTPAMRLCTDSQNRFLLALFKKSSFLWNDTVEIYHDYTYVLCHHLENVYGARTIELVILIIQLKSSQEH